MDVIEYEKGRRRMCRTNVLKKGSCEGCDAYSVLKGRCDFTVSAAEGEDENVIKKNIAAVERWVKANPIKTRQSEFLKMFPNADMQRIHALFPCIMDQAIRPTRCVKYESFNGSKKCDECRNDYWNEEVDN